MKLIICKKKNKKKKSKWAEHCVQAHIEAAQFRTPNTINTIAPGHGGFQSRQGFGQSVVIVGDELRLDGAPLPRHHLSPLPFDIRMPVIGVTRFDCWSAGFLFVLCQIFVADLPFIFYFYFLFSKIIGFDWDVADVIRWG